MNLIHYPESLKDIPRRFTNPFRYIPCTAVRTAAEELVSHISSSEELSSAFAEGKMLGVLIVKEFSGRMGALWGFSGNVGGKNLIDGFVPPIYDLLAPDGHFKTKEREISEINSEIASLASSSEYLTLCSKLDSTIKESEKIIASTKEKMADAKRRREMLRKEQREVGAVDGNSVTEESLIRESQHEKAEFRRIKKALETSIKELQESKEEYEKNITSLKHLRKKMSDALQKWIFSQYKVHNATGEVTTIEDIFKAANIVPPGGTGECAAPKLLEYAYRHQLKPIAMGEFWFGKSPDTAVRTHGHFYPSCTSKCGPLLSYMTKGLDVDDDPETAEAICINPGQTSETTYKRNHTNTAKSPVIIYYDEDIAVVDKPSGMPSVPGLDKRLSLQQWIEQQLNKPVYTVHRLDMDTSGVLVYALNQETASSLGRQFEERTVQKEYHARLGRDEYNHNTKTSGRNINLENYGIRQEQSNTDRKLPKGTIELPLSPDYDERPRQKVDMTNGKAALTEYEFLHENADGTTDILLRPITGRTHQLRLHSAHILGLGRPILGDLLYGFYTVSGQIPQSLRIYPHLHLHAKSITFIHPRTLRRMTFSCPTEFPPTSPLLEK